MTRSSALVIVLFLLVTPHLMAQVQSIPQVAVGGVVNGLHYLTTITVFNGSEESLSGTLEFFDTGGNPWLISANGGTQAPVFNWAVPAGRHARIRLSSARTTVESGWARVSPARAHVSAVFQLFDGTTLVSEAGAFTADPITKATALYETRGPNTDTGIAVSNPNDRTNTVTFALLSQTGQTLRTQDRMLPPNGHWSGFLSSLFPSVPDAGEMAGSVALNASLPFSAVSLRYDSSEFTTVPVLPGGCENPRRATILNNFDAGTENWIVQDVSRQCVVGNPLSRNGSLVFNLSDGNCAGLVSSAFSNYNLSTCDETWILVRSDKDIVVAAFTQSSPNFTFHDGGAADIFIRGGEPFFPIRIVKSSISDPAAVNAYGIQVRPRIAGAGVATVEIERIVCVAYPADFGEPQTQVLPQIAVGGTGSGDNYKSTLYFVNNSSATLSGTADIFDDAGNPLIVTVRDIGSGSSFNWTLGPCQTLTREITSPGGIQAGWVRISQSTGTPVGVAAVFQLFNGNTLTSQAGVLSSPAVNSITTLHDSIGPDKNTAIAISNLTSQTVTYTLTLISDTGQQLGTMNQTLGPYGHVARFVTQFFPGVPSALEMEGTLTVTGASSFSAVTLRFDGSEFTTLPVIPGASIKGFVPSLIEGIVLTGFDDEVYSNIPIHKNSPSCTPVNAWFDYHQIFFNLFARFGLNPPCSVFGETVRRADIDYTLDQLKAQFPAVKYVAVLVYWFQSGLGSLNDIKPRFEWSSDSGFNRDWRVGGLTRESAQRTEGPTGGTPSDDGLVWLCAELKRRGYQVGIYPFLRINEACPDTNRCPQEKWRGEVIPRESGDVETDLVRWFDAPWGYKNFQKHYASLLVKNGIVPDAFIIGGELIGVTNLSTTTEPPRFPAVLKLRELARDIRDIVGPSTDITYAADWGEYHHNSTVKTGGPEAQLKPELDRPNYHLDPLWADPNISAVGIDYYFPLTETHTTDLAELRRGFASGRYYDWDPQRGPSVRIPPSVAIKNLRWWWESDHFDIRADGTRVKTAWTPRMKPIWLTEIGYASVHSTTVEPYAFPPALPRGSNGQTDFGIQCFAYQGFLDTLAKEEYVGRWFAWNYDARPFPAFPNAKEIWADFAAWEKGHWLEGKWVGLPGCIQR